MHPYLFTSEHISIPTYGILYLLAFLASIFVMGRLATRIGIPFWRMVDMAFMIVIAGEVGARVAFLIVNGSRVVDGSIEFKQFLLAGRVVLGGIVAGVAFGFWLFRKHRLPPLAMLDVMLAGVPLGMGIGRLACLMGGCCFGKPTDWWWGITFTDPVAKSLAGTPLGVALHPTQILQAIDGFVLFAFMYWMFGRRRFNGHVVALYFLIVGITRFLVEFLRGDPRGEAGDLATSQWIAIVMASTGAVALWIGYRRGTAPGPVASMDGSSGDAGRSRRPSRAT